MKKITKTQLQKLIKGMIKEQYGDRGLGMSSSMPQMSDEDWATLEADRAKKDELQVMRTQELARRERDRMKNEECGGPHLVDEQMQPGDEDAARELRLFIDNDAQLYKSQYLPIIKNLQRKIDRGTYDPNRAPQLWMYLVNNGAKQYIKQFGSPGTRMQDLFPKNVRMAVADELARDAEEEYLDMQGPMAEGVNDVTLGKGDKTAKWGTEVKYSKDPRVGNDKGGTRKWLKQQHNKAARKDNKEYLRTVELDEQRLADPDPYDVANDIMDELNNMVNDRKVSAVANEIRDSGMYSKRFNQSEIDAVAAAYFETMVEDLMWQLDYINEIPREVKTIVMSTMSMNLAERALDEAMNTVDEQAHDSKRQSDEDPMVAYYDAVDDVFGEPEEPEFYPEDDYGNGLKYED